MANVRIPQLTPAIGLSGTEWLELAVPVGDGFESRRIQAQAIGDLALTPTGVSAGTYGDANNVPQFTVGVDGRLTFAGNIPLASGGTVTSVGLAAPADFDVTGSPVTSTGTLTLAWQTQPTGTGAMVRANSPTLVTPNLDTPSAAVLTNATGLPIDGGTVGTLPVSRGGTGITAGISGGIPFFSAVGAIASSALLAASQLVAGGGAGVAPATIGSLGTTTTVLHGNAAGLPTWGAVNLATDVTGNLPVGNLNGGAGANATSFWRGDGSWATPAGAGTVTNSANLTNQALVIGDGGTTGVKTAAGLTTDGTSVINLGVAGVVGGALNFRNATSGSITLQPVAGALGAATLSLPAATDTLIGKATTDTLTNKTFDTAGAGNSLLINGLAATANTGTGAVVRATSPTLVAPDLGTPSAIVLTNATGLPLGALTGLGTGVATALAVNVGSVGAFVVDGGALGTPSSGTLTNATGLPVSTGISGLGANVATFLATPTSANLAAAVTDKTGTGALVFGTSPSFTTDIRPVSNDGASLGISGTAFSDLFLASGGVINWAAGNATLTHSTGLLTSNVAFSVGTALAITAGTIELGAATDTTISRAAAGVIAVEGVPLYSNIPQNSQSAAYTLVLSDAQKHIYHPSADTTARIWTIPANASVAFPIGTAVTFVNDTSAGVITIAITSDTLVLAGTGSTGSRTLAANGMATALKMTSTRWMISGTGLT
jgi:hypothetical protein